MFIQGRTTPSWQGLCGSDLGPEGVARILLRGLCELQKLVLESQKGHGSYTRARNMILKICNPRSPLKGDASNPKDPIGPTVSSRPPIVLNTSSRVSKVF